MRKRIYKWHRTLSLIIAVPVILWAASGFMHPLMTNIRPHIATQFYPSPEIDTAQLKVPLQQCLLNNRIDSISNVHIVQMGGQQFYQVLMDEQGADIRYLSTKTGNPLKNGDELYARFLGKYFLEGDDRKEMAKQGEEDTYSMPVAASDHDCCMMATMNIMNSRGAAITNVKKLDHFDGEYKYINRLLPVYKVSFNRSDGIRIYVETASGKFGFAVDNKRSAFDTFFGICHTWEWMNGLGNTKYFIMVAITLTGFLTTLFGLYIFFTTGTKKSGNSIVKARRRHRYTSLIASLFTLMFTFSGGFHALDKILPKDQLPDRLPQRFAGMAINPDFTKFDSVAGQYEIQGISLCRIYDRSYWQLQLKEKQKTSEERNDLMKSMTAALPNVIYVEMSNYTLLAKGDEQYACFLATAFSKRNAGTITSVTPVTKFTDEYGFVSKRLPVWRVGYAVDGNERYYIETSTGILSARIRDKDLAEGYSFAFFHKHHFMDWGGKTVRDISTMFWATMQIAMIAVGLILYFKIKRRKRMEQKNG